MTKIDNSYVSIHRMKQIWEDKMNAREDPKG